MNYLFAKAINPIEKMERKGKLVERKFLFDPKLTNADHHQTTTEQPNKQNNKIRQSFCRFFFGKDRILVRFKMVFLFSLVSFNLFQGFSIDSRIKP